MKNKRAAIYARVSTDGQAPENQLSDLRVVAQRMGCEVIAEYVDHGISGAKGRDQRPQFDAMLKAAARREIDVIAALVCRPDRAQPTASLVVP